MFGRAGPRREQRPTVCALILATLATGLLALGLAADAQESASSTRDVIFARKTLKDTVCDRMADIERMIGQGQIGIEEVRAKADAIAALLMAFPHLFPPSSNLWKPDADTAPEFTTLASPEVWTSFEDFYRQASAAAKSADALAHASTAEEVKSRARELRISCDTCHAFYLEDQ